MEGPYILPLSYIITYIFLSFLPLFPGLPRNAQEIWGPLLVILGQSVWGVVFQFLTSSLPHLPGQYLAVLSYLQGSYLVAGKGLMEHSMSGTEFRASVEFRVYVLAL